MSSNRIGTTPIDRAREAAARALNDLWCPTCQPYEHTDDAHRGYCEKSANAAIAAYEAALSAEGMVVVPKTPTVGMLKALTASWPQNDTSRQAVTRWALGSFAEDYAAMIAAASAHNMHEQKRDKPDEG